MVDRIGQQLGNYRLTRLLGQGGFGKVYLGEHIHLSIQVAIKVLHDQLTGNEMVQFRNEAQAVARLRHPHIVSILDFGVEGETAFLIMEYAPNGTLLERHRRGTRLSLTTIVPYVKQIADALQYAHQQRLIHLDIKPENMLLGQHDEVLLSDFGMNTVRTVRNGEITFQQAIGTGAYMAPEQIEGHPRPASDQYALGIVVYEWMTGTWPFQGETPVDIIIKHLNAPPPPLRTHIPTISPDVEQVVLTALAKDPKERFGNVRAFATALEQASQSTIMPPLSERKQESIHIFFSYARRDQNLRDQLENHLSNLKYRGLITTWHAREISAGEETIQQIDIHLNTAHIILLLISADFLASEYCYSREMVRALQRHERGEAHVIPVLLRPVLFTDAPFAKLQPLPTNGKPIVNWRNRDSAFVDIALGIERVVQKRLASASPEPLAAAVLPLQIPTGFPGTLLPPTPITQPAPIPTGFPGTPLPSPPPPGVPSISRRGLILVGLSLYSLLSTGVLLVQHPNFIPFVGVIVGSLILLAGIISAIRALVKRAQSRAAHKQEQEQAQRRQLEEAQRREQEGALLRELEEARRSEQERAYYGKALAAYEQALRQNNADATAYRGKGNALVGLERYNEALTAFEQALVLTPLPTTYVSMGNVLVTLRRCDEAVAAYEQALALDATYASAYTGMSKALLQLGRTQEAEQAHEQAKQLGDDEGVPIGQITVQISEKMQAQPDIEERMSTAPLSTAAQAPTFDDLSGRVIKGRYQLLIRQDTEVFAFVYIARDLADNSIYALKILRPELTTDEELLVRFQREAQILAKFSDAHIVRFVEYGKDNDVHFIATEYIDGQNLKYHMLTDGRMELLRALDYTIQAAQGLVAAFKHGVVHRDIKPQNILVNNQGIVKITDFGLAWGQDLPRITQSNVFMGTAYYIPPEQAESGRSADTRSDLYSLAVVLFEMLTGQPPFEGETAVDIVVKHINEKVPNVCQIRTDLPLDVNTFMQKAMAKSPADRYQTPQAFIAALEEMQNLSSLHREER